jgi:hypothetical protein
VATADRGSDDRGVEVGSRVSSVDESRERGTGDELSADHFLISLTDNGNEQVSSDLQIESNRAGLPR